METNNDLKQGLFKWSAAMSVGNSVIDADHKMFLDLVNLLILLDGDPDDLVIESAIGILEEYVQGHFYREEKAMKLMGYEDYVAHRLIHEQFKVTLGEIAKSYREGTKSAADGLPQLVGNWLTDHIQNDDQACSDCFRANVVDDRPLAVLAAEEKQT